MLLTLRQQLTKFAHMLQEELFPTVEAEVGELSEPAKRLTAVLAMIPLRRFVPVSQGWNGRPSKDRYAIACAFVAKIPGVPLLRILSANTRCFVGAPSSGMPLVPRRI